MTAPLLIQILKMLFFVLVGFVLRRTGRITNDQSKGFSIVSIYVIIPCAILLGFQKDVTPGIGGTLLKYEAVVLFIHVLMLGVYTILRKVFKFTPGEGISMIYPNTGNMIIPIVMAILGNDCLIYCGMYMMNQAVFIWSHGYSAIAGESKMQLKNVLFNPSMLASMAGFVMFVLQIKMPTEVYNLCNMAGSMTAPLAMMTAGVLMGEVTRKDIKSYTKMPLMVVTRLIIIPILVILLLKGLRLTMFSALPLEAFIVLFLSTVAPPASTIVHIAQVFTDDAKYVSCINSVCMVFCAITMPIVMALFELVI